jgi:hypothetical protein
MFMREAGFAMPVDQRGEVDMSMALLIASLELSVTADVMSQMIDKCEAALHHIVHVSPRDVALVLDAQHPGVMTDQEYSALMRAADAELYKRRVAYYNNAYGT